MGEDARMNNKSTVPVLVSHLFDAEPDWNEMEFLIKWKGQSHLHCQWKSLSDLQNVCPDDYFLFSFLINLLHIFIHLYPRCPPPLLQQEISALLYGLVKKTVLVIMLFSFLYLCFIVYVVSCSLVASRRFLTTRRK